jgi:hypothetical protein
VTSCPESSLFPLSAPPHHKLARVSPHPLRCTTPESTCVLYLRIERKMTWKCRLDFVCLIDDNKKCIITGSISLPHVGMALGLCILVPGLWLVLSHVGHRYADPFSTCFMMQLKMHQHQRPTYCEPSQKCFCSPQEPLQTTRAMAGASLLK